MLLRIHVNPDDVVYTGDGVIIVRVHHYGPFANGAHLTTAKGETQEDWHKALSERKLLKGKSLFVGVNGGLSLE